MKGFKSKPRTHFCRPTILLTDVLTAKSDNRSYFLLTLYVLDQLEVIFVAGLLAKVLLIFVQFGNFLSKSVKKINPFGPLKCEHLLGFLYFMTVN